MEIEIGNSFTKLLERSRKETPDDVRKRYEGKEEFEEYTPDEELPEGIDQIDPENFFIRKPVNPTFRFYHWSRLPVVDLDMKIYMPYKLMEPSKFICPVEPRPSLDVIKIETLKDCEKACIFIKKQTLKDGITIIPTPLNIYRMIKLGGFAYYVVNLEKDITDEDGDEIVGFFMGRPRILLSVFSNVSILIEYEKFMKKRKEEEEREKKLERAKKDVERMKIIDLKKAKTDKEREAIEEIAKKVLDINREDGDTARIEVFRDFYRAQQCKTVEDYFSKYPITEKGEEFKREPHKLAEVAFIIIADKYRGEKRGDHNSSYWFPAILDFISRVLNIDEGYKAGIFFSNRTLPRPITKSGSLLARFNKIEVANEYGYIDLEDFSKKTKFRKPLEMYMKLHIPQPHKYKDYDILPLKKNDGELREMTKTLLIEYYQKLPELFEPLVKSVFEGEFATNYDCFTYLLIYERSTPVALITIIIEEIAFKREGEKPTFLKAGYFPNLILSREERKYNLIDIYNMATNIAILNHKVDMVFTRDMGNMASLSKRETNMISLPYVECMYGYNLAVPFTYDNETNIFPSL